MIGIAPFCPKDNRDIKPGGGVAAALLGEDRLRWSLLLSLGRSGGKGRAMVLGLMLHQDEIATSLLLRLRLFHHSNDAFTFAADAL